MVVLAHIILLWKYAEQNEEKKSTSSGTYKTKLTEKSEIVEVDDVYYTYGLRKKAFRNQMVDKFLYYVMEIGILRENKYVLLVTLHWALE